MAALLAVAVVAIGVVAADATRIFGRRRIHGLRRSRHPRERHSASPLGSSVRSRHRVLVLRRRCTGCQVHRVRTTCLVRAQPVQSASCAAASCLAGLSSCCVRGRARMRHCWHPLSSRHLDSVLGDGDDRQVLRARFWRCFWACCSRSAPCAPRAPCAPCARSRRWRRRAAGPTNWHSRAPRSRRFAGCCRRGDRRRWFDGTPSQSLAVSLPDRPSCSALHAMAPSSGETMVRRFFRLAGRSTCSSGRAIGSS